MNRAMKPVMLLVVGSFLLTLAHANPLSDADREALLQRLEEIRANADSKVDARYRAAIAAYQAAMSSEQAAIDLYLNCVEKVNFKDQQRKPSEFREWKRKESDNLSDPGMGMALRLQLRWLVITLRAASEKTERAQLLTSVREVVDALVRDADKLKNQSQFLNQSVTSSLFARAYDLGEVEVDNWAFAPGQIGQIYEQILFPPLRSARQVDALRSAWLRRISQETRLQEFLPAVQRDGGNRRIGIASAMRGPERDRFIAEVVPGLQWNMETDLFKHGDQQGAATRMLAHLERNISHKSSMQWVTEFAELLSGKGAAIAPQVNVTP
jgi:hypothetical protein